MFGMFMGRSSSKRTLGDCTFCWTGPRKDSANVERHVDHVHKSDCNLRSWLLTISVDAKQDDQMKISIPWRRQRVSVRGEEVIHINHVVFSAGSTAEQSIIHAMQTIQNERPLFGTRGEWTKSQLEEIRTSSLVGRPQQKHNWVQSRHKIRDTKSISEDGLHRLFWSDQFRPTSR